MVILILKTIVILLAVTGLLSMVRGLFRWTLKTGNQGKLCVLVPVKGHDEQAELKLRGALERFHQPGCDAVIFCVDLGMDEETKMICRILCREHAGLFLCAPEQLQNYCTDWFANT